MSRPVFPQVMLHPDPTAGVPHTPASSRSGGERQPPIYGVEGGTHPGPAPSVMLAVGPANVGFAPTDQWNRCRYCGKGLTNSRRRAAHERMERQRMSAR
jgi:hypothetical protein